MAFRTLELTLVSAKDLKNVNIFSRMEVYAVVSLSGDPRSKQRTLPDRDNGRNPNWNATLSLTVPLADPNQGHTLHIVLRSARLLGDRDVGEVRVPLRDLLADPEPSGPKFLSYQVRRTSGKAKGVLSFSYKLCETLTSKQSQSQSQPRSPPSDPVTAYPAAAYPAAAYPAYPPPGPYPPPAYPPYGYGGYPPAGYGYGAPVPAPAARKNNFGMGLGAGMLGGAIGGMLIGGMMSDAVAYDAGYSSGFDDAGGLGF